MMAIFQGQRWGMMKVRFCRVEDVAGWDRKLTTKCNGEWAEVRPGRFVGKRLDAAVSAVKAKKGGVLKADPGIVWPEARLALSG
jgi:hypothetical protein